MESLYNKQLLNTLIELGLSRQQAEIYLAALVCGGGTVTDLARIGQIERSGIYYYINELIRLGFLNTAARGHRTIYLPADPTKLEELLAKKEKTLEQALPKFHELFAQKNNKSQIVYFQGKDALMRQYREMGAVMAEMTKDEVVYIFAQAFQEVDIMPDFFKNYFAERAKMKVKTYAILPKSEKPSKRDLESIDVATRTKFAFHVNYHNRKYIDDKYISSDIGTIIIARNFVSMIDYKTLFGSITENKNLANTWRMFFQFIWEHLG
ncbi:MAG: hypothetical protein ACD_83C00257G0002 [uncultured bacterium]|uniref:Transcriptional regulator, TrmB n=1 Tax=Berkelbacteria bacterium GW2011_GWA2_38_9 TaxID=1618334 RepID=A0A0G0LFP1_9BACT|nr:MAG: hypothetical protein ACD_83C00257G0002 [uncultured bacterium]KKQ86755.1 MAG: Transcriptional regulator, TrmB [Berkelbacteria bacterium GW2011_GWA2_38_9]